MLVEAGAIVDSQDKFGQTPLWVACSRGHVRVVRLFLKAGARTFCGSYRTPSGHGHRMSKHVAANEQKGNLPHQGIPSDAPAVLMVVVIIVIAGLTSEFWRSWFKPYKLF